MATGITSPAGSLPGASGYGAAADPYATGQAGATDPGAAPAAPQFNIASLMSKMKYIGPVIAGIGGYMLYKHVPGAGGMKAFMGGSMLASGLLTTYMGAKMSGFEQGAQAGASQLMQQLQAAGIDLTGGAGTGTSQTDQTGQAPLGLPGDTTGLTDPSETSPAGNPLPTTGTGPGSTQVPGTPQTPGSTQTPGTTAPTPTTQTPAAGVDAEIGKGFSLPNITIAGGSSVGGGNIMIDRVVGGPFATVEEADAAARSTRANSVFAGDPTQRWIVLAGADGKFYVCEGALAPMETAGLTSARPVHVFGNASVAWHDGTAWQAMVDA